MFLQHFNFITVRVFYKKELGHQCAISIEFDDVARIEPCGTKAAMFALDVVDGDG